MMIAPNYFRAQYTKVGKPTSTRVGDYRYPTFEGVLEDLINTFCKSVFKDDYRFWYDEDILLKRLMETKIVCRYLVSMLDHGTKKTICEYEVEIECLHDSKEIDIMERFLTIDESISKSVVEQEVKKDKPAKWIMEEGTAVKFFLLNLIQENGNLNKLKTKIPKATYYRNLKICKEKGYVVNGKLAKNCYE